MGYRKQQKKPFIMRTLFILKAVSIVLSLTVSFLLIASIAKVILKVIERF